MAIFNTTEVIQQTSQERSEEEENTGSEHKVMELNSGKGFNIFQLRMKFMTLNVEKERRQICFLKPCKSSCIIQAFSFTSDFSFWIIAEFIGTC